MYASVRVYENGALANYLAETSRNLSMPWPHIWPSTKEKYSM